MSDNPYSIPNPKVDPSKRPARRPDNTPDDNNRIEIGPTPLAYTEWQAAGLHFPYRPGMRRYRLARIARGFSELKLVEELLFNPFSVS